MAQKPIDLLEAKRWLEGQKVAQEVIKRERVQFLLSLTPEKSLDIYLALWEACCKVRKEPSFLLMRMRQCIGKLAEKAGGGKSEPIESSS